MMILPEPEYYSFKQLSDRWGIPEDQIEVYLRTDIIKECSIIHSIYPVPIKEIDRTLGLSLALNSYAVDQIDKRINDEKTTKKERAILMDFRENDFVFKHWLQHNEWEMDKVIVVIPNSEVKRLENEYKVNRINGSETHVSNPSQSTYHADLSHGNYIELEKVPKYNLPNRKDVEIPHRKKSPLTMIIEHVFDARENGAVIDLDSWDSIYKFLNNEVTKEARLSNGQSIAYYLEKVSITGTNRGLFMKYKITRNHSKKDDYWYSEKSFKERFSKERKKRNTLK